MFVISALTLPEKKPISVMAEEEKERAEKETKKFTKSDKPKEEDSSSCVCTKDREKTADQSNREKEVTNSIVFENALHNKVYIKRMSMSLRRRRDTSEMLIAANLAKEANEQVKSIVHCSIK